MARNLAEHAEALDRFWLRVGVRRRDRDIPTTDDTTKHHDDEQARPCGEIYLGRNPIAMSNLFIIVLMKTVLEVQVLHHWRSSSTSG